MVTASMINACTTTPMEPYSEDTPLPLEFPYYSLVTYPNPERISTVLKSSYNKLSKIDARNDSQLLFYDQVIPGSSLLGYLNADHWVLAVPVARSQQQ